MTDPIHPESTPPPSGPVRVLTVGDRGWAPHVATTLRSVIDAASDPSSIELLVGAIAIPIADRERIQRSVPDHQITWVEIPEEWIAALPRTTSHRSQFGRLHALETLSRTLDRVIYVDSDVLVTGDLAELWAIDIEGHLFGAARCLWGLWMGRGQWNLAELGLDGNRKYAQSGVMLIDLANWRRSSILARSVQYIERFGEGVRVGDQEIFNAILDDDWFEVPVRWNVYANQAIIEPKLVSCAFSRESLAEASSDPGVVHFAGRVKPWDWAHPDRHALGHVDAWEQTAMRTDYADTYRERRSTGLAELAARKDRARSPMRRIRRALHVLLHG